MDSPPGDNLLHEGDSSAASRASISLNRFELIRTEMVYKSTGIRPNRIQRATASKKPRHDKQKGTEQQIGLLSALLDAPVEIFCEVLLHLSPRELLSLSRASRQFRKYLLSKQNKSLWTASLASTGLPPCPSDLNEIEYTDLIFGTDCNACGNPCNSSALYELRIRLCRVCQKLNVLPGTEIVAEIYPDMKNDRDIYYMSPSVDELPGLRPRFRGFQEFFYKPDLTDAVIKYMSLSHDFEKRKIFLRERQYRVAEIMKHTILLQKWKVRKHLEWKSELADDHEKSVKRKLRALGYTDEDWAFEDLEDFRYKMEWGKLAHRKKYLTDESWDTLEPKLKTLLEARRLDCSKRQQSYSMISDGIDPRYMHNLNLTFGDIQLSNLG